MTKEEYAELHYLLGKLKYLMFIDLKDINNKAVNEDICRHIDMCNEILKLIIIEKS